MPVVIFGNKSQFLGISGNHTPDIKNILNLLSNFQQNSKNIAIELQKYQPILPYFLSRQSNELLLPVQNITNMIIVGNLNF